MSFLAPDDRHLILTHEQQDRALTIVAYWLGKRMGYEGPAPTGLNAAHRGQGPRLDPKWDWAEVVTPTILLEGGPFDWAVDVSMDPEVIHQLRTVGVYAKPYAGYALCLYPRWP